MFKGQKVQNHGSPAGIAAPAPAKKQRSEDFGDCIMNGCRFKNAQKQIIPEAFNLHIFIGKKTEINKHIQAHAELNDQTGVFKFIDIQAETYEKKTADISKIKQIKNIVQGLPQSDGDGFKNSQKDEGRGIFLQGVHEISFFRS